MSKKNITSVSIKLDKHIVWETCVEHEFYTRGDNEEYEHMFDMVKDGASMDAIAEDIAKHSEIEEYVGIGCDAIDYVKKCLIVSHVKNWYFDVF